MQKAFMLFVAYTMLLTACNSEQVPKNRKEEFLITTPLLLDTTITKEYVASIQSIQNIEIRSRVKGYIETILLDEGKTVQAGQPIFILSNNEFNQELNKVKAILKIVMAEAKQAELEAKNAQLMFERSVISKTELEMAQAKLDAANAKVEEAHSNESQALLNLSYTQIKAPFSGVINRIPYKVGSLVEEGVLLTTLSNNESVYAYFNVSEREYLEYITRDKSDQELEVNLVLANNQKLNSRGKIETIDSEFDKQTGNIAFRARFSNPEALLKHGATAKILLTTQIKNALIIPQKSTFEIQENTYVYVIDDSNIVRLRPIKTKYRLPSLFIIENGLKVNEKILFEGIQLVKDGDTILPKPLNSIEAFSKP